MRSSLTLFKILYKNLTFQFFLHLSLKLSLYFFRKHRNIQIWDSSNSLAQEYVRGCTVFHNREIPKDVFVKGGSNSFINCKSYINCDDYIHTGYVALSQATNLLYNDICNINSYVKYAEQKLI